MRDLNDELESTEITLGTGKLLGLFLGLVVICAVFFSLGYAMGKNSGAVQTQLTETPSTLPAGATPAQKPDAGYAAPVNTSASEPMANEPQSASDTTSSETPAPAETAPAPAPTPKLQTTSARMPAADSLVVQIAAVSKREDADILLAALKRKGYQGFLANSHDNLFHVQLGPYGDMNSAKSVRDKLAADGYTPIIKR